MADIFISYKKEDAGRVIRLVEALRAEGFSVWWDHGIKAGSEWDRAIRQELDAARLVVAIWSQASVNAPWVKEEANVGKSRGILLPVKIDEVDPPLGFTLIQAADLVGWRGDREDQRWGFLLGAIRGVLAGETPASLEAPLKQRGGKKSAISLPLVALILIALVVAVGAITFFMLRERETVTASRPAPEAPASAPSAQPASAPATAAPAPQPAAAPPPPATVQISASEQGLWDRAMEAKTRQGFQTYLVAYPNGAYAQRARDILLTCRTETQENWKPGPDVANQMLRGVGDTSSGMTSAQACAKAKSDVREQAKRICQTIVTNGNYRNAKWTVSDAECDCKSPNPRVTVCIADLPYSCRWEMKMTERIEICGG
jgi:hypothetical protein